MEHCKANLGKKDPKYGGVLTDMTTLPIGTKFFVCNGCWDGEIVELDGLKAIKPAGHLPVPMSIDNPDNNILSVSQVRVACTGCKTEFAPAENAMECPICGKPFCRICVESGAYQAHIKRHDEG